MKIIMVRSHPINPDVRLEKETTTLSNAERVVILGGRYGKVKPRTRKIIIFIDFSTCATGVKYFFLPYGGYMFQYGSKRNGM